MNDIKDQEGRNFKLGHLTSNVCFLDKLATATIEKIEIVDNLVSQIDLAWWCFSISGETEKIILIKNLIKELEIHQREGLVFIIQSRIERASSIFLKRNPEILDAIKKIDNKKKDWEKVIDISTEEFASFLFKF